VQFYTIRKEKKKRYYICFIFFVQISSRHLCKKEEEGNQPEFVSASFSDLFCFILFLFVVFWLS